MYPEPTARPMAIAKKTDRISLEFPGMLRNLTKVNVPATAIEVPRFPFTMMITVVTKAGKIAKVLIKF